MSTLNLKKLKIDTRDLPHFIAVQGRVAEVTLAVVVLLLRVNHKNVSVEQANTEQAGLWSTRHVH